MNEKEMCEIVKCNNCGQVLISASSPIKCDFGPIGCRKCGSKIISVKGKLLSENERIIFEI